MPDAGFTLLAGDVLLPVGVDARLKAFTKQGSRGGLATAESGEVGRNGATALCEGRWR